LAASPVPAIFDVGYRAPVYTTLLILHFIGLALGIGTGFANMTLGMSLAKLPEAERGPLAMRFLVLSKNGSIGLTLLILTGVGMMLMRGVPATFAWGGGAFHAKLTLVVLMIGIFGYMQMLIAKLKKEGPGPAAQKLPVLGRVMLLLGIGVIVCATIAFH
jgi:hypothetical protein